VLPELAPPQPVLPGRALPDVPPLGAAARYAGMSPAELEVARRQLLTCAGVWRGQVIRFRDAGLVEPLGGPCAEALVAAVDALVREMRSYVVEVERQAAELRRGAPA
jgi:hypothetical protein